jgi:hypothetical protein
VGCVDNLWGSAPPAEQIFDAARIAHLPGVVQRYLRHAIATGTPLANAVRLRMHGEIKLKSWLPFTAEEVISWGRGMIWRASVRLYGLRITGADRLVDGKGAMRWRVLGLVPLMTASGPDITRSATGRLAAETVWLRSILCRDDLSTKSVRRSCHLS